MLRQTATSHGWSGFGFASRIPVVLGPGLESLAGRLELALGAGFAICGPHARGRPAELPPAIYVLHDPPLRDIAQVAAREPQAGIVVIGRSSHADPERAATDLLSAGADRYLRRWTVPLLAAQPQAVSRRMARSRRESGETIMTERQA